MSQIAHLSRTPLESPFPDGMIMGELASLFRNPNQPAGEYVEVECSQKCGATITCMRFFADVTACDTCRHKYEENERVKRAKVYWESIIPPLFRETDIHHVDFPKAAYMQTKEYRGEKSLFLFGDSRTGKTRLGVVLLKRCLLHYNMHIGVLWPEHLKSVKSTREVLQMVEKWGRYDLLMLDDALLTGAQDERVADFLKDLIDYRMRYKRTNIITSQIGSVEYLEQGDKFGNMTKADKARIDALLKRIKETSEVVPTGEPLSPKEEGDGDLF